MNEADRIAVRQIRQAEAAKQEERNRLQREAAARSAHLESVGSALIRRLLAWLQVNALDDVVPFETWGGRKGNKKVALGSWIVGSWTPTAVPADTIVTTDVLGFETGRRQRNVHLLSNGCIAKESDVPYTMTDWVTTQPGRRGWTNDDAAFIVDLLTEFARERGIAMT